MVSSSPWRSAGSLAELGRLMALWLEGRIPGGWPGYDAPFGHEEHDGAGHLVPTLAALCRAGFVTTESQPGTGGPGADGAHWRQRAFVAGYVRPRSPLLARLRGLEHEGLAVLVGRPRTPVPLTDRDGLQVLAASPRRPGRDHLAREWSGIGRRALRDVRQSAAVHVYDPEWGRDGQLWRALDRLA
ncbi:DUF6919 domain-containing protein [Streptomyces hydrogenans]